MGDSATRHGATDAEDAAFHFSHDAEPSDTLVCGFSEFGLAGLTAADFLVDHLELTQTGHVAAPGLPAITPFENGVPRHHTRFFSRPDLDLTVLVGELFVPVSVAATFSDALIEWLDDSDVSDVAVLSGVPVAHGPDDHRAFYVATDDYREEHLADAAVPPMGNGFVDGLKAELLERGIDDPLRACVYTTPVHAQAPDVEASIRLVEAVSDVHDLGVDTGPLEAFAEEVAQHYAELSERVERIADEERPDDRMYM
ncbi:proteasome assembly chaperone family protein [Halobacterium bonnevillei]|uniref:Proteasome assembly chaperone family protein n=1 Tax=Halobacterium bonnevillei TaxID=2692200 RepID=A0A6B0SIF6_9EURY|nr:PAC2 family protein [Halobacterium bonnevillei]MXR21478.1 proteasome assembly chaperone family protein [Halobacterium bonnevillei]